MLKYRQNSLYPLKKSLGINNETAIAPRKIKNFKTHIPSKKALVPGHKDKTKKTT